MSTPNDNDFARLAEQLREAAPALPSDALARVQEKMQAALDAKGRHQRRRRLVFGWSIAAAILLTLGSYGYFRISRTAPPLARENARPEQAMIEDRIIIAMGDTAVPTTEKPLVRLDDYRILFAD